MRHEELSVNELTVNNLKAGDSSPFKNVSITVAATASSASSSADSELAGGQIMGYYPTSNQDQFVDSIALNANGSVTVTLAAAATAANVFTIVVRKK